MGRLVYSVGAAKRFALGSFYPLVDHAVNCCATQRRNAMQPYQDVVAASVMTFLATPKSQYLAVDGLTI